MLESVNFNHSFLRFESEHYIISYFLLSEQEKNRAHFYVYCSSPCKSVQVGKLRVRCARCGSGAVTVDRDPQCWPDVLLPSRITVHCENDFCQTEVSPNDETESQVLYGYFYFKCAKHPSLGETDGAVPLYLIKPNLGKVPCLACTDTRYLSKIPIIFPIIVFKDSVFNNFLFYRDTVLVFPCEAGHVTCLDCFREYCLARLRERQFQFDDVNGYYTLPCPAGCPDSFIPEVHHFHLLPQQQVPYYYYLYCLNFKIIYNFKNLKSFCIMP